MRSAPAPAAAPTPAVLRKTKLLLLVSSAMASSTCSRQLLGRPCAFLLYNRGGPRPPRSPISSTACTHLGHQQQQQRRILSSSFALLGTIRGGGEGSSSSKSRTNNRMLALAAAAATVTLQTTTSNSNNQTAAAACSNGNETTTTSTQQQELFPEDCLEYDHYNGVTVHVDERLVAAAADAAAGGDESGGTAAADAFQAALRARLERWRAEGRRGVWLHVPRRCAAVVPAAARLGFAFHQVVAAEGGAAAATTTTNNSASDNNVLVLSQWLPTDSVSRLPSGPTHQVGVGCLVWHPGDDPAVCGADRRMLVVQERTGPAAAFNLWKMPTGLADPSEDVHEAAVRELLEETGLPARFDGLLAVRQAHSTPPAASNSKSKTTTTTTTTTTSVRRKHSDLFFVCQLSLTPPAPPPPPAAIETTTPPNYWDDQPWTACPTEIAAIRWMPAREYAAQERWQSSPVYLELNRAILDAAAATDDDKNNKNDDSTASALQWKNYTLPLRYGHDDTTNALYKSGVNGKKSVAAAAASDNNDKA